MAIQKYARTQFYGYGFLEGYGYSPVRPRFAEKVTIVYRGHDSRVFDTGMKQIMLRQKDYSGNFKDVAQPLYLVEDGGVWKEYFSGTEVKYFEFGDNNHLFRDATYYIGDIYKGKRELVIGKYGYDGLSLMSPQDFADAISKYSDDEIKNMVKQFFMLRENAAAWGARFDEVVEKFKKSQDSKTEMAANKLVDGMGKYANVQPDSFERIISNQAQLQPESSNKEEKSGNGIIPVLIFALIVLFVLWIIK